MDKALVLQNLHWGGQPYLNLFTRETLNSLVKKLPLKEIQVLLGVRRSGKSTLFKLLINHLLEQQIDPKSIVYVNLDDPFYKDIWTDATAFYQVLETAEKITGIKPQYLFLDEIQEVTDWERFVKSCYDNEVVKKIWITGSNSSLLKKQYAKLLSGRYVIDRVAPLSFKEILATEDIRDLHSLIQRKSLALKLAEDMLYFGSFPEPFKNKDPALKREILLGYYDTIILKDCIVNHSVRETKMLKELALYIMTNNACLYSYNSLAKTLNCNDNTIREFMHILEEAFLIDEITNFSYSLKKQVKGKKKNYCVDNGLIQAVSFQFSENKGRMFENLVYGELKKAGLSEIYYLQNGQECDFLAKDGQRLLPIQVCYELNIGNREREVSGLLVAMEKLNTKEGILITFNQEEPVRENIKTIPFWKFFFESSRLGTVE